MSPEELARLLQTLVVEKFLQIVYVIAGTSLAWVVLVWMLERASRWSERYRLWCQRFIPWVKALLVFVALYMTLAGVMKLSEEQLVYVIGVAVVAVGLSSKEFIGSIVAYFSIVWNKPYQMGDRVHIGEVYGQVLDIGLLCTKLRTPADSVATVPNHLAMSGVTVNTNYAALHSMADIDFYLANGEDCQTIKKILWEAAATSKFFFPEKAARILVAQLRHCTRYRVKAYTYDTRAEFRFMSDVTETAKREFARRGISYAPLPFAESVSHD